VVEKEPILIGLTGGIASGKSTVIQYLRYQGFPVIDADKLGHKVLEPGNPGYSKVVKIFGEVVLNKDKTVNRLVLGGIVFADPSQLKALNEISHPIIAEMVLKEFESIVSDDSNGIVVFEAALLIEANWYNMCHHIWVVTLEITEERRRIQKGDFKSYYPNMMAHVIPICFNQQGCFQKHNSSVTVRNGFFKFFLNHSCNYRMRNFIQLFKLFRIYKNYSSQCGPVDTTVQI
jgi:dephospho-CoA kinase